jgi:hypothetical protein
MARRALYADPKILADLAAGIETGGTVADVCKYAGIGTRTYERWQQRGNTERTRLAEAELHEQAVEPDPVEAPFVAFVERMDQAAAGAKLSALRAIQKAWNGWDVEERTVVTKDISYENDDGATVHALQTTTTVKTRRDFAWAAAMTWLERRYPGEFARLVRNELTGAEGTPLLGTADELKARAVERLDQLAAKRAQHAADEEAARAANGDA